jgi:hypothetical protein
VSYGLAAGLLLTSGMSLVGKLLGVLVLLIPFLTFLKNLSPNSRYLKLERVSSGWRLAHKDGSIELFESHRVLVETGLFFIVRLFCHSLEGSGSQRVLVIFFDELPPEDYRALRILEKIN